MLHNRCPYLRPCFSYLLKLFKNIWQLFHTCLPSNICSQYYSRCWTNPSQNIHTRCRFLMQLCNFLSFPDAGSSANIEPPDYFCALLCALGSLLDITKSSIAEIIESFLFDSSYSPKGMSCKPLCLWAVIELTTQSKLILRFRSCLNCKWTTFRVLLFRLKKFMAAP